MAYNTELRGARNQQNANTSHLRRNVRTKYFNRLYSKPPPPPYAVISYKTSCRLFKTDPVQ